MGPAQLRIGLCSQASTHFLQVTFVASLHHPINVPINHASLLGHVRMSIPIRNPSGGLTMEPWASGPHYVYKRQDKRAVVPNQSNFHMDNKGKWQWAPRVLQIWTCKVPSLS